MSAGMTRQCDLPMTVLLNLQPVVIKLFRDLSCRDRSKGPEAQHTFAGMINKIKSVLSKWSFMRFEAAGHTRPHSAKVQRSDYQLK